MNITREELRAELQSILAERDRTLEVSLQATLQASLQTTLQASLQASVQASLDVMRDEMRAEANTAKEELRNELIEMLSARDQALRVLLQESLKTELGPVTKQLSTLSAEFDAVRTQLSTLNAELGTVKRTVNAIEALPVPYGRPKVFFTATQFQSVTEPVLVRQGHQG